MEFLLLLIRLFLAAVFTVAAVAKLSDLNGSEKAAKDFGVPEGFAKPFAIVLPFLELLFAVLLVFISTSWVGAIGTLLLLLVFTSGMIYQMAKGNAPDCHCFGQLHSEPVSGKSLIRNILLGILAFFVAARGTQNQGLNLFDLDQPRINALIGFAALALMSVAILYLQRLLKEQKLLMRKLEVLELVSRDGADVKRDEAGIPHEGLPIGAPFPAFELADLDGTMLSIDSLADTGKPALFVFVGPNCNPCEAILPEIEAWQEELEHTLNFVFFSSGTADVNKAKFSGERRKSIVLEKEREIAIAVGARWTPTVLYVDSEGRIASHLAAGDTAIRELVGMIRREDLNRPFTFFASSNGHGRPPKIGQSIPEFKLTDLAGKEITHMDFHGKETLVAFWSLTCSHCQVIIEEFRNWERTKGEDEPNLVLFSDGDPEEHQSIELDAPILLDKDYATAVKFGMFGTPSAVLVDQKGTIVSETAIGGPNIWALIGKRKI